MITEIISVNDKGKNENNVKQIGYFKSIRWSFRVENLKKIDLRTVYLKILFYFCKLNISVMLKKYKKRILTKFL